MWDPNSISSPVYCWDEEAPQDHRTRTRPNRLVVSLWGHHSGDGKVAWQKSIKTPIEVFIAPITEAFGLTLELRSEDFSETVLFDTNLRLSTAALVSQIVGMATGREIV
jgi:hypothetical protein